MKADLRDVRRDALIDVIRRSGLGVSDFAVQYLARDPSAVYRWLSGDTPVPRVVARWIDEHSDHVGEI